MDDIFHLTGNKQQPLILLHLQCEDCNTIKSQHRWPCQKITSACATCKTITPHKHIDALEKISA